MPSLVLLWTSTETTSSRSFISEGSGTTSRAVKASGSADGYTIVQLETLRGTLPPTLIHLAKDAAGVLRIIGLRRL